MKKKHIHWRESESENATIIIGGKVKVKMKKGTIIIGGKVKVKRLPYNWRESKSENEKGTVIIGGKVRAVSSKL